MYDYRQVKREHSKPINKVLSEPTMVFDFLEVKEAFFGIFCFLYFGIIETRPMLLLAILAGLIFIWPPFREKIPRGFIIHKINITPF